MVGLYIRFQIVDKRQKKQKTTDGR